MTLVVLNQADRLTPDAVAACRADLGRLLRADGLDAGEVLVTSARDGSGVVDLQHRVSVAVAGRTAAVQRLDGDVRSVAGRLRAGVADTEPRLDEHADADLVDALTRAAGLPVVLDAVERDYRREASARTGWPFTRWVRPAATRSAAPPAAGHADRGRHAWRRRHRPGRRPCGAGTFVAAAGDARSAVGGRAGHPRRSATGPVRQLPQRWVAVGGRRGRPRPAMTSATPWTGR